MPERRQIKAVVDFVELDIETPTQTQPQHVRQRLKDILPGVSTDEAGKPKKPYVQALDQEENSSNATRFRLRIYDPETFAELERKVSAIIVAEGLELSPSLVSVEFSLDFYGWPPEHVVHLYCSRSAFVSDNERIYLDPKRGYWTTTPRDWRAATEAMVRDGHNIAIGNTRDDVYLHYYFKETDNGGGPLPHGDRPRPRAEVRLTGNGLWNLTGFDSLGKLDMLRDFDFRLLNKSSRKYFNYRKIIEVRQHPVMRRFRQTHISVYGPPRQRPMRGRIYGWDTEPDTELNRRIGIALDSLTKRWRRGARQAKVTVSA